MKITPEIRQFCDSASSIVPYFGEYKYIPKPTHIEETYYFDNKIYMKKGNRYFCGISLTNYVREIPAKDFNVIKNRHISFIQAQKKIEEAKRAKVKARPSFDF